MRQQRISNVAKILMVAVVVFALFWTVEYTLRIIHHVGYSDWTQWRAVEESVVITPGMRALVALFYVPVFVVALASFCYAMRLLQFYRAGIIFDHGPAVALIGVGLSMVGVAVVDTYVYAFEETLLSAWNSDGPVSPRYYYDPGDITIALAGVGFCLIGWITREGVRMREENEGFV
ncbi:MAG: hypothetical protein MK098_02880 [Marinovum sp.]|nr:hypothetical protein [Marinovum sp.]